MNPRNAPNSARAATVSADGGSSRPRLQQLGGRGRAHGDRCARSSPTTCTWRSTCRTSGIARRWSFPDPRVTGRHAAYHRRHAAGHSRASSSAATATSRGASPTPAATGAISSIIDPTRAIRLNTSRRRAQSIERLTEPIAVHGATPDDRLEIEWTIWGPIVRTRRQRPPARAALGGARRRASRRRQSRHRNSARPSTKRCAIAAGLGIPAQNVVAGDTTGRIGWTDRRPDSAPRGLRRIASRRRGRTARGAGTATSRRANIPRVVDPASGRIWTANAPVVTGDALGAIGEGGYADGIRARIIRDRLLAIDQRDAGRHAVGATRHQRALSRALAQAPAGDADAGRSEGRLALRGEFRRLVETTWTGRAEPDSVGYLLVRTFRTRGRRARCSPSLTAPVKQRDPDVRLQRARCDPKVRCGSSSPKSRCTCSSPTYASWDAQLLAAVDVAIGS